jgi:Mannosyltransferase (PIG-V)
MERPSGRGLAASVREVVPLWAALRGALLLVVYLARTSLPERFPNHNKDWVGLPESPLLDALLRWDTGWYRRIVVEGYAYAGPGRESNVAFFPLYPTLVRALAPLFPTHFHAGIFLSNVCFLLGLVVLHDGTSRSHGRAVARHAVLFALLSPAMIFFSAYYTESLFFLEVAVAFWAYERKRFAVAGLAGACASATRTTGVVLLGAFGLAELVALARRRERFGLAYLRARLPLLLVPFGLLAYMAFLGKTFGDPLVFTKVQEAWGRHADASILDAVRGPFLDARSEPWQRVEAVGAVLVLALLGAACFVLETAPLAFLAVTVVLPLATGTAISIFRIVASASPLYVALALFGRRRAVRLALLAVGGALGVVGAVRFALWYWAG